MARTGQNDDTDGYVNASGQLRPDDSGIPGGVSPELIRQKRHSQNFPHVIIQGLVHANIHPGTAQTGAAPVVPEQLLFLLDGTIGLVYDPLWQTVI